MGSLLTSCEREDYQYVKAFEAKNKMEYVISTGAFLITREGKNNGALKDSYKIEYRFVSSDPISIHPSK